MAASDAAHRQPQTSGGTMAFKRFHGVLRTGRMKATTASEHGADGDLVDADQRDQGRGQQGFEDVSSSHGAIRVSRASISPRHARLASRSDNLSCAGFRVRRNTMSNIGSVGNAWRNASLARRLNRLRMTERRARRLGITNPKRGEFPWFREKRNSKFSPRTACRLAETAENSVGRFNHN